MSVFSPGDMKRNIVGQLTANGTTPVTINIPNLEANSFVHAQVNTFSGTTGTFLLTAKTPSAPGTPGVLQFTGTAGNTSTYDIFVLP